MNFALTEEQLAFQKEMREFAQREFAPGAVQRDEDEDFTPIYDIFMKKMGPMGLLGLTMPKEYGGQGRSPIFFVLAMMEFCRVEVSVGASWSVCLSLGTVPLLQWGTEEQKQKYLSPLLKGEKLCAFGLTEENAGSDSAMQETTAVLDGDEYILNGRKIYITNAGFADTYIVFAMTDKTKGTKGISAFVVEKDTPGFTFGKEYKKMGIRATAQRELVFENCRIPKENLLGKEGEGFKIAMTALDVGRIGVAGQGAGAAMGAFDLAVKTAKERVQFGKPISANQAISFKLADMATKIELAQLILLKTAWLMQEGLPYTKEAAMAKTVCTDTAMSVTTDAVQILGGKGYLRENEAERFMRDSKILQLYEGTNQIQRLIVSGHVLK
ncbi:MAG TPA: acyl-CoA dehydrogenase family protein [Anaerovoracaceae bacterium]|nr:acyl-CoA dehydrogenase family protein [Anaerovoracaceae bacterium]